MDVKEAIQTRRAYRALIPVEITDATIEDLASNAQLAASSTLVEKITYDYDRSGLSETEREETLITINHNKGKYPLVQVIDLSSGTVDYFGQYITPDTYFEVMHVDENTFVVRSDAAIIKVIAIY